MQTSSLPSRVVQDTLKCSLRQRFSTRFVIGTLLCATLVMLLRATQDYPTEVFDFYPLYYGAKAWWHDGTAYMLDNVVPVSDYSHPLFVVGNTYPLPAALLVLPFSFLPGKVAAITWLGFLTAGLLVALRLYGVPNWLMLYFPLWNGLNLEQFTVFILILQIVALWAYRERRPWILALCCTLILTKPNQGIFFVLALLLLSRQWRHFAVTATAIWGGSLLLDPHWVTEWIPALLRYRAVDYHEVYWQLAILAIPLLLLRNVIGGAIVAQFLVCPWPVGPYPVMAVPLAVIDDARSRWLMPLSFLWPLLPPFLDYPWTVALILIGPVVLLVMLRRWEETQARSSPGRVVTVDMPAT